MKKLKTSDILLTILVAALLVAFAAATPWPSITDAAYTAHLNMLR